MYRVLIVDDEEPVLESFTYVINGEADSFEVCGTARSGEDAVAFIVREEPDLVFMDVQMAGIDGIEAIRQVRDRYPDIVFILATAYERFDIAKKVIPLNVFSYLVKPVTKRSLLAELERVKEHLDGVRERQRLLHRQTAMMKESRGEEIGSFISSLMLRNPSQESWTRFLELTGIAGENACIAVCILREKGSVTDANGIYRKMAERIQYKHNCRYALQAGMMILLVPAGAEGRIQDVYIREAAGENNVEIAIGDVHHYTELMDSFLGAFEEIQEASGPEVLQETRSLTELADRIIRADSATDHNSAEIVFDEAWRLAFASFPFEVAKGKMVALFSLLLARSNLNVFSLSDMVVSPAEEIIPLQSVGEWEKWYPRSLSLILDFIHENRDQELPPVLVEAMDYIKANYNRPLQLADAADHCGISAGYLSRLFSQHLRIRFVDYLNQYRVQQAQVLLRDRRKTVKEISWAVGFQDPNYFSRLFRRYTGVSPRDHE